MFIRRIVDKLKSQNFSVAGIELVVVILGVFIGIQVSNWNDGRKDETRALAYLERIRADLDSDIANFQNRLSFWAHTSEYGKQGLDYAATENAQDLTEWDLLLAYFQASQLAEFFTTRAAYDELISGGELGLIRDLELRNSLANYYTNADNPALSERPVYREHVRGVVPLRMQKYIWEHCYASDEVGNQTLSACQAPADAGDTLQIVEAISRDEQLMSELRYWMSTMHVASLMGRDRIVFARQLRDSVDAEIGNVPQSESR